MSVLHEITVPPRRNGKSVVVSDLGEWECCANEVHTFHEPMVSLTVSIDDDHTLHLFCEAHQVDAAVDKLKHLLGG